MFVYNATVYPVDKNFSGKEAVALNNGKIIVTGNTKDLQKKYDAKEKINVQGKFIYPGLIERMLIFFLLWAERTTVLTSQIKNL